MRPKSKHWHSAWPLAGLCASQPRLQGSGSGVVLKFCSCPTFCPTTPATGSLLRKTESERKTENKRAKERKSERAKERKSEREPERESQRQRARARESDRARARGGGAGGRGGERERERERPNVTTTQVHFDNATLDRFSVRGRH